MSASALPGPFFQTLQFSSALYSSGPRPFNSQTPPLPIPELHDPQRAWTWPSLERGAGAAKFSHTDPFSHTQKSSFFARRREQRKSLTSTMVQQLKLGLGCGSATGADHRAASLHRAGSGSANLGREKSLFSHFGSRDSFSVTEPERKKSKELCGVQINSRGELTLTWREPFFREF